MRSYLCVLLVAVLFATCANQSSASSTRRPLIPGLPPVLSGLSLANIPGISHIMNMPLPFNVPFSLSSLPPLRLPIRLPAFLGGAGMLRNATHLIRNTFLTPGGSSNAINTNSLTSYLAAPLLPLLNLGGGSGIAQAANRNILIDPLQYAQYFRALQLQSAHERRRRSIVQQMLRNYQPGQVELARTRLQALQMPLEAQFRMLYRYH
ncbi:uncharacterized protein LOC100904653 [Galendromus occidentalis]|uniref:Uncharacterized protein LOC100904653 n=1 Tax=Galendromus occidentalis TaxID=34638 RepID=A0AAJ6VWX4_9ACAR|nr:uncharacterized protein LOC100904653 [Galendromus occidentalis]